MEASALELRSGLPRHRLSLGTPLLRLRSDDQLVAQFRAGDDEAFRVIHDRYRQRLFAYTRQMLPHRQDAEDALQDVFIRAYSGLRTSDRELALRAWLYRVAHNRCIDELRRPVMPPPELLDLVRLPLDDPIAQADERESLRRLIADIRRLPTQQRSALLMRELGGMSYADLGATLGISVPAVKSVLVRARIALAKAREARNTACSDIHDELALAHDRGIRPNATARRHLRDCAGCRDFRHSLRGTSRQLAAVVPGLGPLAALAQALGIGGGASSGAAASGGMAAAGGAVGTGGAVTSVGVLAGSHVATLIAAAVVTAGGAVELQNTIGATSPSRQTHPSSYISGSAPAATAPAQNPIAPRPAASVAGSVSRSPQAGGPTAASSTTGAVAPAATPSGQTPTKPAEGWSSSSIATVRRDSPIGNTAITGTANVSGYKWATASTQYAAAQATTSGALSKSSGSSGSSGGGSSSTSSGSGAGSGSSTGSGSGSGSPTTGTTQPNAVSSGGGTDSSSPSAHSDDTTGAPSSSTSTDSTSSTSSAPATTS